MIDATKYGQTLGMGTPLIDRIHDLATIWQHVCPTPIESAFVSEYLSDDGERRYDSLWFFAPGFLMELSQFVTDDHGDIAVLDQNVSRLAVDRRDFAFAETSPSSRLAITVNFGNPSLTGLTGNFKASGENCTTLQGMLDEYLLPNLVAIR
jgi:hypothetical protein